MSSDPHIQALIDRFVGLGLPGDAVAADYCPNTEDYEVQIGAGVALTAPLMEQIARTAFASNVGVQFADEADSHAFADIYLALPEVRTAQADALAHMHQEARAELAQEGLLDQLPSLAAAPSLAAFAASLEAFCGYAPGSVLTAADGVLMVRAELSGDEASFEAFQRLMRALNAAIGPDDQIPVMMAQP